MDHNDFYLYIKHSVGEQEKTINWNLEVQTECEKKKKDFHNRINKQFAQAGCKNSIFGGFQDLPRESAKQSGLNSNAAPALSRSRAGRALKVPSKMNDYVILRLRSQSKCFSCFLCQTPADMIIASLSVHKMRNQYCDQVVFSHPHCLMVYHPKNNITTHGNDKLRC